VQMVDYLPSKMGRLLFHQQVLAHLLDCQS
jgi:hypothetical protein